MADLDALLKELAEDGENCFPLAATDVMHSLVRHGFATIEQCRDALKKHAPEMMAAYEPVEASSDLDDKIPFDD